MRVGIIRAHTSDRKSTMRFTLSLLSIMKRKQGRERVNCKKLSLSYDTEERIKLDGYEDYIFISNK